jgi:hypothetical protein
MSRLFFPRDVAYVKARAKSLKRAAPWLSTAASLEATAAALGFSSWFDACSRINGKAHPPSLPDEEVNSEERLWRRYVAGCAVVDLAGFSPSDADMFVRYWSPTAAKPGFRPTQFRSAYGDAVDELAEYERALAGGESDEGESGWMVPAERLAPDLMLCRGEKYEYLVPSETALQQIPAYIRGNASSFLTFEGGLALALCRPDWFERDVTVEALRELGKYRRAWADVRLDGSRTFDLYALEQEAVENPAASFPLSCRTLMGNTDPHRYFLPVLDGRRFADFIRNRGALRLSDVRWYEAPEDVAYVSLHFLDFSTSRSFRLSKEDLAKLEPCRPPYLSPFKHGPMFDIEYSPITEGGEWLLSYELEPEDETTDSVPDNRTFEEHLAALAAVHREMQEAAISRLK